MKKGGTSHADSENVWIGGEFNGHCGSDNGGKEDTIGKYGVGETDKAGDNFVVFAMSQDLRVANTYFERAEKDRKPTRVQQ